MVQLHEAGWSLCLSHLRRKDDLRNAILDDFLSERLHWQLWDKVTSCHDPCNVFVSQYFISHYGECIGSVF